MATVTAIVLSANGAIAAPSCFRSDALEAWQAVRYMTELMVLNDTCQMHVYTAFLKHNFAALDAYHRELIDHFRSAGDRHPEDTVDRYVTRVANQVAGVAGSIPTASLCDLKASYFATAETLAGNKFRQFVADLVTTQKSEFRSCGDQRAVDRR
ncbi:MAG: hypothetical protein KGL11_11975 [Alphaproteobacteria bacterium]|nr:hypothetical protein [Alphaproteobacteria bacterium]